MTESCISRPQRLQLNSWKTTLEERVVTLYRYERNQVTMMQVPVMLGW